MKILLFGEYSGFHNNLKEGLTYLGHKVILAARKDGFKNLPSDFSFDSHLKNRYFNYAHMMWKYIEKLNKMKDFDVLQIINAGIVSYESVKFNSFILNRLIDNNKKTFLVGAGEDPLIWNYWSNHRDELRYSWLDGVKFDLEQKSVKTIPHQDPKFLLWNKKMTEKINGYIPIMFEYSIPYLNYNVPQQIIPIPINVDKIKYRENVVGKKLKIFHGLNRYGVKGTFFVEKAFEILRKKYPNDLELTIAGQIPLNKYLEVVSNANIIVDQTRSYSLAMNALQSMAQGRVVLGGNEMEAALALNYKTENPAINILPDTKQIVAQVEMLLDQKAEIPALGYNSRLFVEKEHHYIKVAQQYVNFWTHCKERR